MSGIAVPHIRYFVELGNTFRSRKKKAHDNALEAAQDGDRKIMKKYIKEENIYRMVIGEKPLSYREKKDFLSIYLKNKK